MKHRRRSVDCRPHVFESYEPVAAQDTVTGVVVDPRLLSPPRYVAPRVAPVAQLAAALIKSAAADIGLEERRSGLGAQSKLTAKRNAMAWILGADAPLTFEWACGLVGLDVDRTRASLLALA